MCIGFFFLALYQQGRASMPFGLSCLAQKDCPLDGLCSRFAQLCYTVSLAFLFIIHEIIYLFV